MKKMITATFITWEELILDGKMKDGGKCYFENIVIFHRSQIPDYNQVIEAELELAKLEKTVKK